MSGEDQADFAHRSHSCIVCDRDRSTDAVAWELTGGGLSLECAHEIVELPRSRQGADVIGEQTGVPSEEAQGLRRDLEPLQVLIRTLLHRPHQVPVAPGQ